MNWVAPIKDDETLREFKECLKQMDEKYYIMFEIGVGTGMQLQDILKLKNKDVRDKDQIEAYIGTKQIKRTFLISDELKKEIHDFTEGKNPDGYTGDLLLPDWRTVYRRRNREREYGDRRGDDRGADEKGSGLSGFDKKLQSACPDSEVLKGLAIRGNDAQNTQEKVRESVASWLTELGF